MVSSKRKFEKKVKSTERDVVVFMYSSAVDDERNRVVI